MSKNDHPEQEKDPQLHEGTVDFSDLGPLFAPDQNKDAALDFKPDFVKEEDSKEDITFQPLDEHPAESSEEEPGLEEAAAEDAEEETAVFTPENTEEIQELSQEDVDAALLLAEEVMSSEEESEAELPAEEEAAQEDSPEENNSETENPSVDFSDLGPLFEKGGEADSVPVHAGEAALVLKKLSELAPRESDSEKTAIPETPGEESRPEESVKDGNQSEEPAEEVFEEIPEEDSPAEESASEDLQDSAEEDAPAKDVFSDGDLKEEPSEEVPLQEEEPEKTDAEVQEETSLPDEKAEEKPSFKRSLSKGRPKRKKGEGFFGIPNLLVTVVWIAITVLIGITLGRMAWVCAADVLAFGREDKPVTITVYEADTIEDVTRKLHEAGLIKYPGLFKFYASLAVDEGEIHPGIWDLNTRYDYHALVNMMSPSSSREVIELMIPEGYSCRQIFALMEENKICTSLDLGAYAASGELDDYWFLEGVPRGDMYCLEGYLFPDTYQFYKNDSPRAVLTKMLNNFQTRFDENMAAQIDTLNAHLTELMRKGGHGDQYISEHLFTVRDVINVASLIEKETSSADEGYVIASVIYNRLFNWPDNVPYLNIDATIVYALGGKNKLTQEDLKVNSPYNTYTHTGLTPGPIANPGLSSIRAALDPADSNYYYYVLDPALGSHRFSTTYDEHKANIASIGG